MVIREEGRRAEERKRERGEEKDSGREREGKRQRERETCARKRNRGKEIRRNAEKKDAPYNKAKQREGYTYARGAYEHAMRILARNMAGFFSNSPFSAPPRRVSLLLVTAARSCVSRDIYARTALSRYVIHIYAYHRVHRARYLSP